MKPIAGCWCLLMMLVVAPGANGAKLPASCGPQSTTVSVQTKKERKKLAAIPAGKARLVFVQQLGVCPGCGVVRIGLDGKWVGANKGNSWFDVVVPAGEHHVCGFWNFSHTGLENRVRLTELDAKAGQTYYFETSALTAQYEVNRLRLTSIPRNEGAFLVLRSKVSLSRF